jgi:hypothetical protein
MYLILCYDPSLYKNEAEEKDHSESLSSGLVRGDSTHIGQ